MGRPVFPLVLAAFAWALTTGRAFAQMGYSACSLEWLVADSDVVVRASVARVERVPAAPDEPGVYQEPRVWKTVTLEVRETLKGERARTLTFAERTLAYDRIYEGWKDAGRSPLWFLVRSQRRGDGGGAEAEGVAARQRLTTYGGGWSVIRLGPSVPEEQKFVSMPPPIFAMKLDVLRRPDEILDAARAAVVEGPGRGPARGHDLGLPRGVMQRSGRSGDANSLMVPIDPRLETLGRRLIESTGDFLPEAERVYTDLLRVEGIKALRHFPSEKNVALLKPLLDDPTSSIHGCPDGAKEEKVYDIRVAAYETLHSWGIAVGKPVLREDLPRR